MTHDELIAETNRQIIGNARDVINRIEADPEAQIAAVVQTILCQSVSRSTRIKEKQRLERNVCERYSRKEMA